MQGEYGDLLVLLVGAGKFAAFAVEDNLVGAVPSFNDLAAFVYLPAKRRGGEIIAGEDGPDRSSELFEGSEGGMFGPPRVKRLSTCSDSAVPSLRAVAYLTS